MKDFKYLPENSLEVVTEYMNKNENELFNSLFPRGTLRTSKPKNGMFAYIWRMARFYNGEDMHMPVTIYWDLESEIEKMFAFSENETVRCSDKNLRLVEQYLDSVWTTKVLVRDGKPLRGLRTWGHALGMI